MANKENFNKFFNEYKGKSKCSLNSTKSNQGSSEKINKNIKLLHNVTQNALISCKKNSYEVFDDKRTCFINFQNSSTQSNHISSNTSNSERKNTQIINIININNNYVLDNLSSNSDTFPMNSPFNSRSHNQQFQNASAHVKSNNFLSLDQLRDNKLLLGSELNFILNGKMKENNGKNHMYRHIPSSSKRNLNKFLKGYAKDKPVNNSSHFIKLN